MEKKTAGIIATVVTVLLCGCPGLIGLCLGATSALASFIPNANIDVFSSNDPRIALYTGLAIFCLSLFLVMIPIVVGVATLRNKPTEVTTTSTSEEPLPPPI